MSYLVNLSTQNMDCTNQKVVFLMVLKNGCVCFTLPGFMKAVSVTIKALLSPPPPPCGGQML